MPKDQTIHSGKQCNKTQKLEGEEEISLNSIVSSPAQSLDYGMPSGNPDH